MTHLYAGMKGRTKNGAHFKIECVGPQRGWASGEICCDGNSMETDSFAAMWDENGICVFVEGPDVPVGTYDIPAQKPVRKWRWVMRDDNVDDFFVSSDAYASAEDADAGHAEHCKAIQRIDATEVTE